MTSQYRVVFKGKILDGFDEAIVRNKAIVKLKTTPEQVDRLFSGRSSVLKKGIARELGERYVSELGRIGMQVSLEEIPPAPNTSMKIQLPESPAPAPYLASTDLEKTQLADADALSRYLQESPDPANAPTWIVSPAQRELLAASLQENDLASAPTMIVSPSNAPTLVVSPKPKNVPAHDPERTLIANADALDAYLKNHPDTHAAAITTGGRVATTAPHETELNSDSLDAYLASLPASAAQTPADVRSVPITIAAPAEPVAPLAPAPASPFSGLAPAPKETQVIADEIPSPAELGSVHEHRHQRHLIIAGIVALLLALLWWFI